MRRPLHGVTLHALPPDVSRVLGSERRDQPSARCLPLKPSEGEEGNSAGRLGAEAGVQRALPSGVWALAPAAILNHILIHK